MSAKFTRACSWIVTCALATSTMTTASTTAASATRRPSGRPAHLVVAAARTTTGVVHEISPAARSAARRYWTAERMRKATPIMPRRPVPRAAGLPAAEAARTAAAPPAATTRSRVAPAKPITSTSRNPARPSPAAAEAIPAVGNVYFYNPVATADVPAGDHTCTASALNSDSKNLVITAGRCVHSGKAGAWYENWSFVPGYEFVINFPYFPYGSFDARFLGADADWVQNSSADADFAIVETEPNAHGRLVDVVGGMGLDYGEPLPTTVTAIGYTWECLSGVGCLKEPTTCSGRPRGSGQSMITLGCAYEDDAVGGPWVTDFDGQLGNVNGHVGIVGDNGTVASPYYGDKVGDLYQEMTAAGTGVLSRPSAHSEATR